MSLKTRELFEAKERLNSFWFVFLVSLIGYLKQDPKEKQWEVNLISISQDLILEGNISSLYFMETV